VAYFRKEYQIIASPIPGAESKGQMPSGDYHYFAKSGAKSQATFPFTPFPLKGGQSLRLIGLISFSLFWPLEAGTKSGAISSNSIHLMQPMRIVH
jgi:hypothetical protein